MADDHNSEALIAGLSSGYYMRLTVTSISEVIANVKLDRRRQLARLCQRLLSFGDCIDPQNILLEKLIKSFEESSSFDWSSVDVGFPEAADGISREENPTDEISQQVWTENKETKDKFEAFYAKVKPLYESLFARGDAARPTTFSESMARLNKAGTFAAMARSVYEKGAGHATTDAVVRKFLNECPPFYALMVALCVRRYTSYLKPSGAPSLKAHAADTFMAVCLPYCDLFVTADCGQLRCFREVVPFIGLGVTLKSYQEFRGGLAVAG
ncbi:MAG TPA: hypothetical protein VKS20_03285 [Candidatus Acidoferrales bacterium]|nr:hypothetical protein [Candidatus Acidoferrales bacterium]